MAILDGWEEEEDKKSIRNPQDILRFDVFTEPAVTDYVDGQRGITFWSDDSSGSPEMFTDLYTEGVRGKVDILANVLHTATNSPRDPSGIQRIGYRIYKGNIAENQLLRTALLLNDKTFNMSINNLDFNPARYEAYPTPNPFSNVPADVIFADGDDYEKDNGPPETYGTTLGDSFSSDPIQFVYIVTNNVDPTPSMGRPEYLSKSGSWDTEETMPNGCPKFQNGVYTVVIDAWDYSGKKKTLDNDSRVVTWVNNTTRDSRSYSQLYFVDDDNTSGPWDGSFENPYQTITDALAATPLADYIHVSPGVYESETFPLEMRNGLTLHGESPHDTIIRIPSPTGLDLVHFDGVTGTTLENFQLIGGYNCIEITNSADPLIQNNVIRNSNAPTNVGGGIQVTDSNPDIFNNLILDNKIYGIFCQGSAATIMNNTIAGHNYVYPYPDDFPSYSGKGIYLYLDVPGTLIIRNNIITDNYYGVLKCADAGNIEHSSFNNVGVNSHGQYWDVWPPIATPGYYIRDHLYTPSPGTGELSTDPQFVPGPMPTAICCPAPVNAYYLSQPSQSQCVDAGDDSALPNCSLFYGTTSIDNLTDEDPVDMGFHYEIYYTPEPTVTPTPTGTWSTNTPLPTNTPGQAIGNSYFDRDDYYTDSDSAIVSVIDWDRNTDPMSQETFDVTITSDTDPTGISMTLTEANENSGGFSSSATGIDLSFSTSGSDDINEIIHVTDWDTVTLTYDDPQPTQTSYDLSIWHSGAQPPTATPVPVVGTIVFDQSVYFTESSEAIITVYDADLNTSDWIRETVDVSVTSDTDLTGITVTLYERGTGVDEFSTAPYWTNLTFSTTGSDDVNEIIWVTDGDTVYTTYTDAIPSGDRIATTIWIYASPTPTATPTGTATPPPIPATSTSGTVALLILLSALIVIISTGKSFIRQGSQSS